MHLSIDWWALGLLGLALPLCVLIKKLFLSNNQTPSLAFSQVKIFEKIPDSWRVKWINLPKWFYAAALFLFLLAFIDPHLSSTQEFPKAAASLPAEGIAMYVVLDQSGSMAQKTSSRSSTSKMDLLKKVTAQFIKKQAGDLIGLIAFARIPHILAPLTLDQSLLIDELNELQVVKDPQEDGTALGYALFKAANLISATRHYAEEQNQQDKASFEIKSAVIVGVTDGIHNPSYLDKGNRLRTMELDEVAQYAKSQKIRLYIINIDPALAKEEFAPHRRQLQSVTALTGGEFFLVNDAQDLEQIYAKIGALEKSQIPQSAVPLMTQRVLSFYPYLIFIGLLCFLAGCILSTVYFRKIP